MSRLECQQKKEQLAFWATLAALSIILIVYYFPYLSGAATFYIFDLSGGWQPTLSFIGESVRHGRLPLWNPFVLNGISQISDPAPSVFYPPNLLFAWLPFSQALAAELIIQQLVAGVGAYLLVRSFGWERWAAVLAATAMSLSGQMFSLQHAPTLQGTIAWFIFAWWTLRNAEQQTGHSKLLATVLAALSIYMMIAAGAAEIFLVGLVFLAAYVLSTMVPLGVVRRSARRKWRGLAGTAFTIRKRVISSSLQLIAMGTGVLMSAPILLPAAEWARLSPRAAGLELPDVFMWSCNWYDMICLVLPQPLGDLFQPTNPFKTMVAPAPTFVTYLASEFLGPVVLTLAVIGLCDRTWRWRFWAGGLTALAIAVSLGSNLAPLVVLVKFLNLTVFRYPAKAMVLVACGLVICAARGMQTLLAGKRAATIIVPSILWSLAILIGLALWITAELMGSTLSAYVPEIGHKLEASLTGVSGTRSANALVRVIGFNLAIVANLGLVTALICHQMAVKSRAANACAGILVFACAGGLLFDAWHNQHPGEADFYKIPSPLVERIKQQQPNALPRIAVLYAQPYVLRLPSLSWQYQLVRQLVTPLRNVSDHIDSVLCFTPGQTLDNKVIWEKVLKQVLAGNGLPLASMCRISATPLIAAQSRSDSIGGVPVPLPPLDSRHFAKVFHDKPLDVTLYRVLNTFPRVYFPAGIDWRSPHQAVVDAVVRPDLSGFDPARMTLLEHPGQQEAALKLEVTPAQLAASKAAIIDDRYDRLLIDAVTPVQNYLVLADQYYPGWQAFVDGKQTSIYPANAIFRAILVPAGSHHIEFVYRPLSLTIGFILFGFGCASAVLLILLSAAGAAILRNDQRSADV